ncbi:hypothetical protein B0T26DRAFT_747899 [Lasiosphaeria miniovina]|uniref:Uncharacterized protein n=1 Tax=Lasiosphaeria miniovina TaxID=1954250 RepID=A0AA40B4J6_9PEZI|nr:uncharacterized protein B0T26DRAFT_747899 [Lasiosphaeria miniovina]KAK0727585.1 hypothetical protein B0T26DRAFT_747899 [Lasiosphaeria miniovina]
MVAVLGMLSTADAAALGSSNAKRIPLIGSFSMSPTRGCPMGSDAITTQLTYGNDCGQCNNFFGSPFAAMQSIDVHGPIAGAQCVITVHTTADCSDPGTVSGPGCWSPEGMIRGWTITCPGADPSQTYMPPCASKTGPPSCEPSCKGS